MSDSARQYGSLCSRGFAIGLVWLLSLTSWQSAVEATCGDYLMSRGESHYPDVTSQLSADSFPQTQLPTIPHGCPHGECRSRQESPDPVGSTVDRRIVDEVRSFGSWNACKSQDRNSACGQARPVDELLPESPFIAELERPPQSPSV